VRWQRPARVEPPAPGERLSVAYVLQALADARDPSSIVVEEAPSARPVMHERLPILQSGTFYEMCSGGLGFGMAAAVGVALARPQERTIALIGDGSAMYTIQALWTMAREKLNVVTVVMNNRSYAILNVELQRVGAASSGPVARSQLDLGSPAIDFVQMGLGLGVPSVRTTTTADFVAALERALATPGPHLIEAVVPSSISGMKLKLLPRVLASLAGLPAPLGRVIKRKLAP
jgi:acetolactate synthase-1/2/3 large subunit